MFAVCGLPYVSVSGVAVECEGYQALHCSDGAAFSLTCLPAILAEAPDACAPAQPAACSQRGGSCARCRSLCVLGFCPGLLSRGPGCHRCGSSCRGGCRPCLRCRPCLCPSSLVAPRQLTRLLILKTSFASLLVCVAPSLLRITSTACSGGAGSSPHHDGLLRQGGQLPAGCCRRLPGASLCKCWEGWRGAASHHGDLQCHAGGTPLLMSPNACLVRACLPSWISPAAGVRGSVGQLPSRHRHPHSRRLLHRQRAPKREC